MSSLEDFRYAESKDAHMHHKLLKVKERILKAARKKQLDKYKGASLKLQVNFFLSLSLFFFFLWHWSLNSGPIP
jgi:hypothetical protein